jgi:hypothetical protein
LGEKEFQKKKPRPSFGTDTVAFFLLSATLVGNGTSSQALIFFPILGAWIKNAFNVNLST